MSVLAGYYSIAQAQAYGGPEGHPDPISDTSKREKARMSEIGRWSSNWVVGYRMLEIGYRAYLCRMSDESDQHTTHRSRRMS